MNSPLPTDHAPQLRTNALFYGDNLRLLREHVPTASIDLIYADPPFSSNRDYFVLFKDRTGKASAAQEEAFTDTWNWDEQSLLWYNELLFGQGNEALSVTIEALRRVLKETPMMAYLAAMTIRLVELHRVLKPSGSLFLHLDPTASHYVKIVLDIVFGPKCFTNEVIWQRHEGHSDAKRFGTIHDVIFYYRKSPAATFHKVYTGYSPEQLARYRADASGRLYRAENLTGAGFSANRSGEWRGVLPGQDRHWMWSIEEMERLLLEGRILLRENGKPRKDGYKAYLDEMPGKAIGDLWTDIKRVANTSHERLGYPTQKPLALLERIITAASNPGDIVLDPFCGCGTAVDAAQSLGRRWIGMDLTTVAVDIIRARMEQRHPEIAGKIPVIGFPQDLESAQRMFEADPFGFQEWACLKLGAHPRRNKSGGTKGADAGIDGWLNFEDRQGTSHRVVVQVKGGKVSVSQVRDFCHVVAREKATLGFFVCMGDAARQVTGPMKEEALGMGLWTSAGGHEYPVVQILTVKDIFEKGATARYPLQDKRSALGYKASKQAKATGQLSAEDLFGQD